MTTVVSLGGPLTDAAAAILENAGVHVASTESYPPKAQALRLLEQEKPEGVVIRLVEKMDEDLMRACGQLKVIAKHGAGCDDIDLAVAKRLGIRVLAAVGCNAHSVAEHALALMLALAKDLRRQDARVRHGEWDKMSYRGFEVHGRRLGLVGFGQIAQILAQLAGAMGITVSAFDPFMPEDAFGSVARMTELDALLRSSDFVSLHTPLTPQTRGLIGRRELELMGSRSYLINTARGEVVDEAALVEALTSGTIAGAGLDTFATEPPGDANPLWALENVIVSPHCGGVTGEARGRVSTVTVRNVLAVIRDQAVEKRYFVC
jgi:D-3-phosphoglycerate dehydrogenase